jgi:DeoR family fructose operon transcriptional repressor
MQNHTNQHPEVAMSVMYAEERHEAIAGLVRQHGRVSVSEVASTFGVTTETVRRDLAALERAGLLRRCTAGPCRPRPWRSPSRRSTPATSPTPRRRTASPVRPSSSCPGPAAASCSTRHDDGRLAALLPTDRDLLVITHAVPLAARLAGCPGLTLHVVGGAVRGSTQAAVGAGTGRALSDLRADVVFVGTNALMPGHGLTTPNAEEAAVKRALVRAGRTGRGLSDSSKIGEEQLVRFAELSAVDVLVTDDGISAATAAPSRRTASRS